MHSPRKPLVSVRSLVEEYLQDCFRAESAPRVKELASLAGVAPALLARRFYGESRLRLSTYFRLRQISHAQRLLLTTNQNCTKVGYASAFQTRATFFRVFRRHAGCTPEAFRRRGSAAL